MFIPNHIGLFIVASLLLLVIPGPAVLYIFARTIEQGRSAGLVSILGIHAATLVHIALAALGLSAVIASYAVALGAIRYLGAAYLIWLGARRIFSGNETSETEQQLKKHRSWRLFYDGFLVNLLNPKTVLFFLAFLPQFVDADRGHLPSQIALLGLFYVALGLATDCSYALVSGATGAWLRNNRRFQTYERYGSGTLLIGLGLIAGFSGGHGNSTSRTGIR